MNIIDFSSMLQKAANQLYRENNSSVENAGLDLTEKVSPGFISCHVHISPDGEVVTAPREDVSGAYVIISAGAIPSKGYPSK